MTQKHPSPFCASLQPHAHTLCRAVFDELMDKDLLGVLLSAKHFRVFMANTELDAAEHITALAHAAGSNAEMAQQLQLSILNMYSGIYIEECRLTSEAELHKVLDAKLHEALACESDDAHDEDASLEVELAWRYRRTCSFGSPIAF